MKLSTLPHFQEKNWIILGLVFFNSITIKQIILYKMTAVCPTFPYVSLRFTAGSKGGNLGIHQEPGQVVWFNPRQQLT